MKHTLTPLKHVFRDFRKTFFRTAVALGATLMVPGLSSAQTYSWQEDHAAIAPTGDITWTPKSFQPVDLASVSDVRYIDYESGDDNNTGTSTSSPWKHHPMDVSATGNADAHADAGIISTYVFKRGVVYRGGIVMDEAAHSGTASNPVRLTSHPDWGSGKAMMWGSATLPGNTSWVEASTLDPATLPSRLDPTGVWALSINDAGLLLWGQERWPEMNVPIDYRGAELGIDVLKSHRAKYKPLYGGLYEIGSNQESEIQHLARTPDYAEGSDSFVLDTWHQWDDPVTNTTLDAEGNLVEYTSFQDDFLIDPSRSSDYLTGGTIYMQYNNLMGTPWPREIQQEYGKNEGDADEWQVDVYDPATGSFTTGLSGGPEADLRYMIENLPQFLDAPGEFYVDMSNGMLYYKPEAGVDPNTLHLELATIERFLYLDKVSHVEVSGLDIRYHTKNSIDIWNSHSQPAPTAHITIKNCTFAHNPNSAVVARFSNHKDDRLWAADILNIDDIQVLDNEFYEPWNTAVGMAAVGRDYEFYADVNSRGKLGDVKIMRNYIENSGHRHLGNSQSNIPAISVKFPRTAEIAGNVIDRSWGSGIVYFGGQNQSTFGRLTTRITNPMNRALIYQNETRFCARAINDYGGIAPWQGGSTYVFNNNIGASVGHMPAGFRSSGVRNLSYPLYLDGGYKHYSFNNVIWARTTDPTDLYRSQTPAYFSVFGFLNHFSNNSAYRHGTGVGGSSGHKNEIVSNVFSEIEFNHFANNRSGDPSLLGGGDSGASGRRGVPTLAFADNIFQGNADGGQLLEAKDDPLERGGVTDDPDGTIGDLAANASAYPIREGSFGTQVSELPITGSPLSALTEASQADFRLTGNSAARDAGATYFVPWQLYGTVGEWHFNEDKTQPNNGVFSTIDFSWYMYDAHFQRSMYEFVPTHDLIFNSASQSSFVDSPSEDWAKGAIEFDGSRYASHSDIQMREDFQIPIPDVKGIPTTSSNWTADAPSGEDTDGDGIPDEYTDNDFITFNGAARKNPAISTENVLLEANFRIDGGTSGALIGKHDGNTGYRLFINAAGKAEFQVSDSGNDYSVETTTTVNDGSWQHVIAEMDRVTGIMNIYLNGSPVGSGGSNTYTASLSPSVSIDNSADLLIGKANDDAQYLNGAIDFMRLCHGTLADATTSIEELYAWQTDGPFKYDMVGNAPVGRRDAGALESMEPYGASTLSLDFNQATQNFILSWQDNSQVEDGYKIQRSLTDDFASPTEWTVDENVTSFTDSTANTGTVYYYRVITQKAGAEAPPSPVLKVAIGVEAPYVPSDIGFRVDGTDLEVEWEIKDPDDTFKLPASWTVKWTTTPGSNYSSATALTSSYTITNIDPTQVYHVIIEAVNGTDTASTPEYSVVQYTQDFSGVAVGSLPSDWSADTGTPAVSDSTGATSPSGTPLLLVPDDARAVWDTGTDMQHHAFEIVLVRLSSNGYSRSEFEMLRDNNTGDGLFMRLKMESNSKGNVIDVDVGSDVFMTPDSGENTSDPAIDVGEAWTLKVMTAPSDSNSTSQVDIYFQLLDETDNDRVDSTSNAISEKVGDWYVIRNVDLPSGVTRGSVAVFADLKEFAVDSITVSPFVAPGVTFGSGHSVQRYEAEDFTAQSGTNTKTGNNSTGSFQDYGGSGTYIEWNNVDGGNGGTATLDITYAIGGSAARYADIYIDGESTPSVSNLEFLNSGGWSSWTIVSTNVTLNSGMNTIRIEASPGSKGPNIDYMDVTVNGSGGGDTTPPAAPANLVANGGDGQVTLDWDDNGESDLDGYDVYRGTSSGFTPSTSNRLNTSLLTNSNYTDTTVTNGTEYFYVVSAVDTSNNVSLASNEASATPSAPVGGGSVAIAGTTYTESDFASYDSASNQDDPATGSVVIDDSVSPTEIQITGNRWISLPLGYDVTANTMLKFEVSVPTEGEIQGIGLDENDAFNDAKRLFQVYGSDSWSNAYYVLDGPIISESSGTWDYAAFAPGWVEYTIPVGQYYTGTGASLVIANDHDVANPDAEIRFRNIEVYEDSGLPTALVHWDFDENGGSAAGDASGNGRDGVITGATFSADTPDGSTSALSFGGSGDYVEDADASSYLGGLNSYTISVWVKSNSDSNNAGIYRLSSGSGDSQNQLRYDVAGWGGGGTKILKAGFETTTDSTQGESENNVMSTSWQHIALSWSSGAEPKIYVDGQPIDWDTDGNPHPPGVVDGLLSGIDTLLVGRGGQSEDWDGLIDDFRIYGEQLSDQQIADIYSGNIEVYESSTISASNDDAEEEAGGNMQLTSGDLDMGDKPYHGMRFTGLNIPQGATITNAYIQFTSDSDSQSATSNLTISAEDVDNAADFSSGNISGRTRTSASVAWAVPAWNTALEAGADQQSPDLSAIVQEIINRGNWQSGNALAIIIEDSSGKRAAKSFDADANLAPVLHVTYE